MTRCDGQQSVRVELGHRRRPLHSVDGPALFIRQKRWPPRYELLGPLARAALRRDGLPSSRGKQQTVDGLDLRIRSRVASQHQSLQAAHGRMVVEDLGDGAAASVADLVLVE